MLLNDITPSVASGYWDWRIGFWDSAEGKALQKYNAKRRGAKTRGTNNARKTPATKTLLMQPCALNSNLQIRKLVWKLTFAHWIIKVWLLPHRLF